MNGAVSFTIICGYWSLWLFRKERRRGLKIKERILKLTLSATAATLGMYLREMIIPVTVLLLTMIADYISGVMAAWVTGSLNSKTGKHGAIKKVGYMFLVIVAGIIDWVIYYGLSKIGIEYDVHYYFGLLVAVWLILNELLSILENCTKMGLPIPKFIEPVAKKLKHMVENGKEDD